MTFSKENRYGLLGTIVFHTGLLLLLLFVGFTGYPPLIPGDEGITVNFGDSETGLGDIEPSPVIAQDEPTTTVKQEDVPAATPAAPAVTKVKTSPAKEEVETQDFEKTAAIEAAKAAAKKKKEEDRLEKLETERKKKEILEQQRVAAEAKAKQEADNRRIAEIENRTKGAFGKGGGTGGTGNGNGTSQGVTYGGGNQGVPTGDPNSDNYGPGGRGSGTKGTGISYNLEGRTATSTPKPSYPGREDGTVVVKITVDKNGKVTSAEPGQRGTTTMNPDLFDAAKRAAMLAKFNIDENAPAFQFGTITYRFVQSQ